MITLVIFTYYETIPNKKELLIYYKFYFLTKRNLVIKDLLEIY